MPKQRKSVALRTAQAFGFGLAGLLILLLVAGGVAALVVPRLDWKPMAERAASGSLGRLVTFGSIQVRWSDPINLEITDLALANAPWGSQPEMMHIGHLSALVDLRRLLLDGVIHYERLRIADATIVLERDPKGVGNWKFGNDTGDRMVLVPRDRTDFPDLVDFIGERALVTYRTRGGQLLRIRLDRVAISSPSDQTSAQLLASGAYNDVPLQLDASTDSYAVLRDSSVPFGARFTLSGEQTDIAFDGRLWDPLDFDGVRGELSVDARALDEILRVAGSKAGSGPPLSIAGILRRDGDHWAVAAAKGQLSQSHFSGDLALTEQAAGTPDKLALNFAFSALDVDDIAASLGGGGSPPGFAAIPLDVGDLGGIDAAATLTASQTTIGGRQLQASALQGRIADGSVTVKELSFALGDGKLDMAGTLARADDRDGRISLQARLSRMDLKDLMRALGASTDTIQGQLDGAATLSMVGKTIGAALARSAGAAVVTLRDGSVARSLIEQLSTDLRSLFREQEGDVPVSCMLGIMTLADGIGILSPLRLKSHEAVAIGAGKLDLANDHLDLTLRTERDTTSFFALDIPVRISGPFDHLKAEPLMGSDEDWLTQPAAASENLPPELGRLAEGTACRD